MLHWRTVIHKVLHLDTDQSDIFHHFYKFSSGYITLPSAEQVGQIHCSEVTKTQSWILWLYTPLLGLRRMQPDPEACVHCGLHELWLLLSPQALWPMRAGLSDTPSSVPLALLCRSVRGRLLETDRRRFISYCRSKKDLINNGSKPGLTSLSTHMPFLLKL